MRSLRGPLVAISGVGWAGGARARHRGDGAVAPAPCNREQEVCSGMVWVARTTQIQLRCAAPQTCSSRLDVAGTDQGVLD